MEKQEAGCKAKTPDGDVQVNCFIKYDSQSASGPNDIISALITGLCSLAEQLEI